ncbi:BLUF domain-containing protein [Acinetobacter brisouii]|uniref:BLUF domain-containing protein n=1 Tax=Acinetobacter brisouii TaxID=396323 RepID=UPI00124DC174|nr:BLUF domain-containing protein [Acinetobacter brisouii]
MIFQLCYTSKETTSAEQLMFDLREILSEALYFNRVNQIRGALFFANGCFFQCLEGDKQAVLDLFERIQRDVRHDDIINFPSRWGEDGFFNAWSMKLVRKRSDIHDFFMLKGLEQFEPCKLSEIELAEFLSLLRDAEAEEVESQVE